MINLLRRDRLLADARRLLWPPRSCLIASRKIAVRINSGIQIPRVVLSYARLRPVAPWASLIVLEGPEPESSPSSPRPAACDSWKSSSSKGSLGYRLATKRVDWPTYRTGRRTVEGRDRWPAYLIVGDHLILGNCSDQRVSPTVH